MKDDEYLSNLERKYDIMLQTLKQIESWTRNPRAYEPSTYTIHHLVSDALEKVNE
ncbi:hypothetical protein AAC03nite_19900 [Alicyclobacillus acidoterrestris]|nr:hypothetical protein AAC03nite_19900 [Alicyclobacillus acidoterrestris]